MQLEIQQRRNDETYTACIHEAIVAERISSTPNNVIIFLSDESMYMDLDRLSFHLMSVTCLTPVGVWVCVCLRGWIAQMSSAFDNL